MCTAKTSIPRGPAQQRTHVLQAAAKIVFSVVEHGSTSTAPRDLPFESICCLKHVINHAVFDLPALCLQ